MCEAPLMIIKWSVAIMIAAFAILVVAVIIGLFIKAYLEEA